MTFKLDESHNPWLQVWFDNSPPHGTLILESASVDGRPLPTKATRDKIWLDQALVRLEAGRYGLCADCGEPIALARLQSAPQSLRCVACESAHERGQPRPATM